VEETEGVAGYRWDGGRRHLLQQTQNWARMVVERSASKDGRGECCKTAVEAVAAGCSPVAGAYFGVTQILIFGELTVCMHMATGLKREA